MREVRIRFIANINQYEITYWCPSDQGLKCIDTKTINAREFQNKAADQVRMYRFFLEP